MRDAQRLEDAFRALMQGRPAEALVVAREVARANPRSAPALHLTALCHQAMNEGVEMQRAFRAALALAPADLALLGNYAGALRRIGAHQEAAALYRTALRHAPGDARWSLELGLALLEANDPSAVAALREATLRDPASVKAWHGLGSALRAQGELASAAAAFDEALKLNPRSPALWINRGVVHRLMGDPHAALSCHAEARRLGFNGPELADAEASAWLDLGDPVRALRVTTGLIAAHPAYVPGQVLHAQLLWEHGSPTAAPEEAGHSLQRAIAAQPAHAALRRAGVDFLQRSGDKAGALALLRAVSGYRDVVELAVMEAQLLDEQGGIDEASRLFASLAPRLQEQPVLLLPYVRHLLRRRDPAAAAACVERILAAAPFDQEALAWLGVAWRMLDDAREEWLCGYETLIRATVIEAPAGLAGQDEFLQALEASLLPLHTAMREPMDQSLRRGTQTAGPLLGRREPLIIAARDALMRAVRRYVDALPADAEHPFLRRRAAHARFAGSWSVRLQSSGLHVNHVHPQGWISSAFYVALPPSMRQAAAEDRAGWLQFGQPPAELGLGFAPRRMLQPKPGELVLFPSYLWHGTLPFTDARPRLTIAFDAVPSDVPSA